MMIMFYRMVYKYFMGYYIKTIITYQNYINSITRKDLKT